MARVTLHVHLDDATLRKLEAVAAAQQIGVDSLVSRAIESLVDREEPKLDVDQLPPITRRAMGMLRPSQVSPEPMSADDAAIAEALARKYGF